MVGVLKSKCSASFRINQGAFEIMRSTLDCRTGILLMWVVAHWPQTGTAYKISGRMICLYTNTEHFQLNEI